MRKYDQGLSMTSIKHTQTGTSCNFKQLLMHFTMLISTLSLFSVKQLKRLQGKMPQYLLISFSITKH